MNKYIKKSYDFTINFMETASKYIVICIAIIALISQLTFYSQWDVMIADIGNTLISISGRETANANEVSDQGINL
jgi:hypothetical protein